jgi:hypothetical protein
LKYPVFQKPTYFPVLGFMTGPPGFYRNGGLFRWLKIFLLRVEEDPLFLSQVLHFLDFGIARREDLDPWLRKPVLSWIREKDPKLRPRIFLDSGGFQFLHDANDCLKNFLREKMEIDVDRGGSLELQRRIGADYIVTFDYPLDQRLERPEAWERCRRSLGAGIETLRRLGKEPEEGRPFPFLAVHGLDAEMAGRYTRELFARVRRMRAGPPPFGLAVGSLVPLTQPRFRNFRRILEIVGAVMDAVPEAYRGIPVHALGMSGPIVPFLVYLGVRSFDGSSFIVAANNLTYTADGKKKNIYLVTEEDLEECGCRYCRLFLELGLPSVRETMKGKKRPVPDELAAFDPLADEVRDRMDGKSSVYGLLAMHNYTRIVRDFGAYGKANLIDGDPSFLRKAAEEGGKELADAYAWLRSRDGSRRQERQADLPGLAPPPPPPSPTPREESVSLELNSNSFNVLRKRKYRPRGRVALVLPCTPQKPYGESKTHKRILEAIRERFPSTADRIEKITLSGLYGPVPESFEREMPVLRYDYRLRTYDIFNPQKELVQKRLLRFLGKFRERFDHVILYAAKKPYRGILENAKGSVPGAILLPSAGGRKDIAAEDSLAELLTCLEEILRS